MSAIMSLSAVSVGIVSAATTSEVSASQSASNSSEIDREFLESGVNAALSKIPVIGDMFAKPLTDLLEDALGIQPTSLDDISQKIDDLSQHLDQDIKSLSDKIDSNTTTIVDNIYNSNELQTYRNAMESLKVNCKLLKTQLQSLNSKNDDGTPVYNDDEKLVKIAYAIQEEKYWNTNGSPIRDLATVGDYLMGKSYSGDKNFYQAFYDSIKNKTVFAGEAVDQTDMFMSDVTRDYLSYHALVMESLHAQKIVVAQINGKTLPGETKTFDPKNLRNDALKKDYEAMKQTDFNDFSAYEDMLTSVLNNKPNADRSVSNLFDQYNKLNETDRRTFYDYGKENKVLSGEVKTFSGDENDLRNFYNGNYSISADQVRDIMNAAKARQMDVAQYLTSNGFDLSAYSGNNSLYLLLSGDSNKTTTNLSYQTIWGMYGCPIGFISKDRDDYTCSVACAGTTDCAESNLQFRSRVYTNCTGDVSTDSDSRPTISFLTLV